MASKKPLPRNQWGARWNYWFWRQQQRNKAKRVNDISLVAATWADGSAWTWGDGSAVEWYA